MQLYTQLLQVGTIIYPVSPWHTWPHGVVKETALFANAVQWID